MIRRAFTLIELLVVVAIIAVMVGLLIPAIQKVRESASRARCQNHLKQFALAVASFEANQGYVVPSEMNYENKTVVPEIKSEHGWGVLVLPYIEQEALYQRYDFGKSWSDPVNAAVVKTHVPLFQCPSSPVANRMDNYVEYKDNDPKKGIKEQYDAACGDYFACKGVKGKDLSDPDKAGCKDALGNFIACIPGPKDPEERWQGAMRKQEIKIDPNPSKNKNDRPVSFAFITDGLSQTLLFSECAMRPKHIRLGKEWTKYKDNDPKKGVEVNKGGGWAAKNSALDIHGSQDDGTVETKIAGKERKGGPRAVNVTNEKNVYSYHTSGSNAAFADGSVRFLSDRLSIAILAAYATWAGGESIDDPDF